MSKYFYIFLLLFFSCKKDISKQENKVVMPEKNIVQKHTHFVKLENISKSAVVNWKEYQSVNENLEKLTSISANEALNNAIQLSKSVKLLKDTIRLAELNNLAFKARINVLENEALRLKDMTFIPAITADEVNMQVSKILEAFSATNSKINTIYSQIEVEKDILKNEEENLKFDTLKNKNLPKTDLLKKAQ